MTLRVAIGSPVVISDDKSRLEAPVDEWRITIAAIVGHKLQYPELPAERGHSNYPIQIHRLANGNVRLRRPEDPSAYVVCSRADWQDFVRAAKRGEFNV
jgi:hypothetical protein